MSKLEEVSIIIPNYNGSYLLRKNLPAVLAASEYKGNFIKEVLVVDDGSSDDSIRVLADSFPQVRLIKHKVNRGFPATVNTGVRGAKGKFVALLNSDVIPTYNFLEKSLPHFRDKKVFAVSFNEGQFGWNKGYLKEGYIVHEEGQKVSEPHISFWASGGSAIFRRDYWMDLGGFDEKLFSPFYWEDIDICYRAYKRGYLVLWEPDSKVIHEHESTIGKLPQKFVEEVRERNHLLFVWKNLTGQSLFRRHIGGLIKRIIYHPGYIKIVFKALTKLRIVVRARQKEMREGKVSDEAIFAKFQ